MNYVKLTPEKFIERLKGAEYQDLTGARRAIGKADWSVIKKEEARAAAEKFFGGGSVKSVAKKAASKAPAKKAATAKLAPAKKGGPAKKSATKSGEQTRTPEVAESLPPAVAGKQLTVADVRNNPFHVIQLAEHGVLSATNVLNALNALKREDPSVDIGEPSKAAIDTIRNSLHLTSLVIQNLSEGIEVPQIISEAVQAAMPMNGTTEQMALDLPGEPVYTGPTAEA